jgi:hypothetical protein
MLFWHHCRTMTHLLMIIQIYSQSGLQELKVNTDKEAYYSSCSLSRQRDVKERTVTLPKTPTAYKQSTQRSLTSTDPTSKIQQRHQPFQDPSPLQVCTSKTHNTNICKSHQQVVVLGRNHKTRLCHPQAYSHHQKHECWQCSPFSVKKI